jgi:calcium binding protein 39
LRLANTSLQVDELAKTLSLIKATLQGTSEVDNSPDQLYQLVNAVLDEGFLDNFAPNLHRLSFESRKDTQVIFSCVLRFRPPTASAKDPPPALDYVINRRPRVLVDLCEGYEHKESATPAGSILREVLKSQEAAAIILYDDGQEPGSSYQGIKGINVNRPQSGSGVFWKFFNWIDKSSFEVAADAFTTFRVRCFLSTSPRPPS